ncbi:MAG TPA: 4-alpha-glucanotransferase [Acidimicrobiales bacterium]|nr:4-alpha-glucanotransferase [Acidimicrobiales bacterium]
MTDPADWGIERGYHDVAGAWREAPESTIAALLAGMGAGEGASRPPGSGADSPVRVVPAGEPVPASGRWDLLLEDGSRVEVEGEVGPDLPLGYHELHSLDDGRRVRLIVSPRRCHLPAGLRTWGWAVQLYSLRSSASWGMGDLADLRELGAWSAELGAGMALLNPLHAPLPGLPQQTSPYYPSSRCWRSPLYLRVEEVPGAAGPAVELEQLAAAGRALNEDRRVDRDAVWRLKLEALEGAWARFTAVSGHRDGLTGSSAHEAFARFCQEGAGPLAGYATFCALSEVHGRPWWSWPADVRHPEGNGVLSFVTRHRQRVRFHQWLQWLVDRQLAAAGRAVGLVQDLAVGVDPAGADAWLWQEAFAPGVRVGAPADEFNTQGQDWGIPPFDPWRLRMARYEPFVQAVRSGLRHSAGLRVDHVMGLSRLFWIPPDGGPAEGTYVRYPSAELLDILALESERAGAFVVGEDLGTVEPWLRQELQARDMLSYKLLWFEPLPPQGWPERSVAAVTTHDLPTMAGFGAARTPTPSVPRA